MLQMAQRQEWSTAVGHGKGTVLRGWIAKSQGNRVKEKGNRKRGLSQIKGWPPETGFGAGLMIPSADPHLKQKCAKLSWLKDYIKINNTAASILD